MHLGCRLRASGICPILCTHPLPKCPLRTSVKTRFLVAGIRVKFHRCMHPYSKSALHASALRFTKNGHSESSSVTLTLLPGLKREPHPEAAVSLKKMVTFVTLPKF